MLPLYTSVLVGLAASMVSANPTSNPGLVSSLRMTDTTLDKLNLLTPDSSYKFDFFNNTGYSEKPGSVVTANAASFPAVVGNEMSMAMLTLGPCSMLPPHLHPRAVNYVVAFKGNTMTTFITENGARTVQNLLSPGQMTIFPRGAIHTMVNQDCTTSQLISALSNEDPGTHNLANGLFGLPLDLVNVALGGKVDVNAVKKAIPGVGTGSIAGTAKCLARCRAAGYKV